jgi:hypothetical protein
MGDNAPVSKLVDETDRTAESMTEQSSAQYAAFESLLRGTGVEAHEHFRALKDAAFALPGVGRQAADTIAATRADISKPSEFRQQQINQTRSTAAEVIGKVRQAATQAASALEVELLNGIMPRPARDNSERARVQHELEIRFAGKKSLALFNAARTSFGQNVSHDAELLSSFGKALFDGNEAGDLYEPFQKLMANRLLEVKGATEKQEASRLALKTFREWGIGARVGAFNQAALTHLKREER